MTKESNTIADESKKQLKRMDKQYNIMLILLILFLGLMIVSTAVENKKSVTAGYQPRKTVPTKK